MNNNIKKQLKKMRVSPLTRQEKDKIWKHFLMTAETNCIKSEASMLQNEAMIELAKQEIKKESEKNK